MKFSTRHDVAAPIDFVFGCATDFSAFELQALRRGIDIERDDEIEFNAVGMCWKASFPFRGKPRKLRAELKTFDAPNSVLIESLSSGIEAHFELEFLPLSRGQTRLKAGLTLRPRTLPARLLIQSLKFAKSKLDDRYSNRIVQFGSEVEQKFQKTAAFLELIASDGADPRDKRPKS